MRHFKRATAVFLYPIADDPVAPLSTGRGLGRALLAPWMSDLKREIIMWQQVQRAHVRITTSKAT